jgi:hypothetical protein
MLSTATLYASTWGLSTQRVLNIHSLQINEHNWVDSYYDRTHAVITYTKNSWHFGLGGSFDSRYLSEHYISRDPDDIDSAGSRPREMDVVGFVKYRFTHDNILRTHLGLSGAMNLEQDRFFGSWYKVAQTVGLDYSVHPRLYLSMDIDALHFSNRKGWEVRLDAFRNITLSITWIWV